MTAGYSMLVDLRFQEQREAWRTGVYEDHPLSLARRLVPDGGVFLDIGANVGFYTCGVGSKLARGGGMFLLSSQSLSTGDGSPGTFV